MPVLRLQEAIDQLGTLRTVLERVRDKQVVMTFLHGYRRVRFPPELADALSRLSDEDLARCCGSEPDMIVVPGERQFRGIRVQLLEPAADPVPAPTAEPSAPRRPSWNDIKKLYTAHMWSLGRRPKKYEDDKWRRAQNPVVQRKIVRDLRIAFPSYPPPETED